MTRRPATRNRASSAAVTRAARATIERLEERQLFSTITWTNEGSAGNDSDGFEASYGDDAEAARDCVRAAISAWERVIVNFNRPDGSNTFDLELTANHIDEAPALGQTVCVTLEDCRPVGAVIELDDDAVEDGWFFDPTPGFNEEFTNIRAVGAGDDAGLGDDTDFYSVALHELGHAMGMSHHGDEMIWDHLQSTGVTDPDNTDSELFTLNGNPGQVISEVGCHVWAEENSAPPYAGQAFDLMNPSIDADKRRTISSFDAYLLEVGYGYIIQDPADLPDQQFMAVINPTNGVLTINGDCNSLASDKITLKRDANDLLVTIGVHTIRFPLGGITSIDVAAATLAGNSTTLTLDMSGGDMIPLINGITFDGDDGADTLNVDLRNGGEFPAGPIVFDGHDGADALHVYGHLHTANDLKIEQFSMILGGTSALTTALMSAESVVVEGGEKDDEIRADFTPSSATAEFQVLGNDGNDNLLVARSLAAFPTVVEGGKGDDTLTVGNNIYHNLDDIAGDVFFNGNDGFDHLLVDNSLNHTDVTYNLTATLVVRPFVPSIITHWSTEERTLEAGDGNNSINIVSIAQFTTTNVHAAGGDDMIIIDSVPGDLQAGNADDVRGTVVLDGGDGANTLLIRDDHDGSGDVCTITENSIGAAVGDTFFGSAGLLKYEQLKRIDILGAMGTTGGANSFAIVSTSHDTAQFNIWGGRGGDAFVVGGPNGKYKTGDCDGVRSSLRLFGQLGDDTLKIDDTADVSGDIATVAPDRVGANLADTFFGDGGSVRYDSFTSMTVYGGSGGNTMYVVGTNAATTTGIRSGLGDDQIFIDSNREALGGTVDTIASKLTVDGSAGNDQLFVQDADDTTADIVTVYPTTVGAGAGDTFFGAGGTLMYIAVDTLTLNAGKAADTVNVLGTKTGTQTVINGNDGVDKFMLGSLSVDTIFSEVVVDGGAGDDLLIVNDTTDTSNDVLTLTINQLGAAAGDSFFGTGGKLTFNSLKGMSVNTGSGADTIHVQRTVPNLDVNLTTGLGADAIDIGWNNRVNEIRGHVTIDGQSDSDTLTLNDSATTDARQVSLMSDKVGVGPGDNFFAPGGYVSFAGINTLNVNAGTSNDTINIWAVNAGTLMTVNAGAGTDLINVDSNGSLSGGTVNEIKGQLLVNGGAGVNTLSVNDASEAAGTTVTVTPMSDTSGFVGIAAGDDLFGAGGKLTYNGVNDLYLYTGTGADTIKVTPAFNTTGSHYHLRAGAGADVLALNLAGVTGPVLQTNPNGTGSLTSANRATVEWTGIESVM